MDNNNRSTELALPPEDSQNKIPNSLEGGDCIEVDTSINAPVPSIIEDEEDSVKVNANQVEIFKMLTSGSLLTFAQNKHMSRFDMKYQCPITLQSGTMPKCSGKVDVATDRMVMIKLNMKEMLV